MDKKAFVLLCVVMVGVLVIDTAAKKKQLEPEYRTRIGLVPQDSSAISVTKEQVTFTVSVIDMTNYEEDTNVWSHYEIEGKTTGSTISFNDMACQPPFFRIVVENGSDQTLKLRSHASGSSDEVIVVLDDELHNTVEGLRKERMNETLATIYRRFAEKYAANPQEAAVSMISNAEAMLLRMPLLTEDMTVLPGRRRSFYTCFEYVPGAINEQEINEWFTNKSTVTLGFYDVPVSRDEAGNVQKKTSYQFTFNVAEWLERYEYVDGVQQRVSSERTR